MRRTVRRVMVVRPGVVGSPPPPPPPPGTLPSPTGHTPTLLWTPEWQYTYDRMRDESHPWWTSLLAAADATLTSPRVDDSGEYAAIAFQVTADTDYAQAAYQRVYDSLMFYTGAWGETPRDPAKAGLNPDGLGVAGGRNTTRQFFMAAVVVFDWIYPGLTSGQRTQYVTFLNNWADYCLGRSPYVGGGTRTADSDECVAHYGGLMFVDYATGALGNARAGEFLASVWDDLVPNKPVGGLTSTGANYNSMRNALAWFGSLFVGGKWIESSEYDLNTLTLVALLLRGADTLHDEDYFPELTACLPDCGEWLIHSLTNDLQRQFDWGDIEQAETILVWHQTTLAAQMAGLLQGTATGPYVQQLFDELVAEYVAGGEGGFSGSTGPNVWSWWFLDPYAPASDWRPAFARTKAATSHFAARTSWTDANASHLFANFMGTYGVDHGVQYFGDFMLYRNGAWGIHHPLGYSGTAVEGEVANAMLMAGLSSQQNRTFEAHAAAADLSWAYCVGRTDGPHNGPEFSGAAQEYCQEWTRSIFWLPGTACDAVVVYDRTQVLDPESLSPPTFPSGYHAAQSARISAAAARKQWIIHSPVSPTTAAGSVTWTSEGGESARVDVLLPAGYSATVYDEDSSLPESTLVGPVVTAELEYQTRLKPPTDQNWDTFLNVVSVRSSGSITCTLVTSSSGSDAEGVRVQRTGVNDALVMFGANPYPAERWHQSGYAVTWTQGTASGKAYLLDLDPDLTWTYVLDGGSSTPLTVTAEGVAEVAVSGASSHTLTLTGT